MRHFLSILSILRGMLSILDHMALPQLRIYIGVDSLLHILIILCNRNPIKYHAIDHRGPTPSSAIQVGSVSCGLPCVNMPGAGASPVDSLILTIIKRSFLPIGLVDRGFQNTIGMDWDAAVIRVV